MLRGEIFSAPCIWANSKFLEVPQRLAFRHISFEHPRTPHKSAPAPASPRGNRCAFLWNARSERLRCPPSRPRNRCWSDQTKSQPLPDRTNRGRVRTNDLPAPPCASPAHPMPGTGSSKAAPRNRNPATRLRALWACNHRQVATSDASFAIRPMTLPTMAARILPLMPSSASFSTKPI